MACPQIITGEDFLLRTLSHIDCQAQLIGSYGYQALGQPSSTASIIVSGLLTLFIALFGIRLMFGPGPKPRDAVFGVIQIGIVITLAFSWPVFRTVVYDVTLKGPAEIASVIQSSSANGEGQGFAERLQQADNAIVSLTTVGSGRNAAAILSEGNAEETFQGAAVDDNTGLGSARILYLASTLGTLGLLRIGAGLLLALAPLVAGLWFFTQSRGIFAGWLRGLVFTFAGSVGATIILSVQLAILEPWLADALNVRRLGYATPAAPTELFAIMLAFAIVQFAMLFLVARIAFYRGWQTLPESPDMSRQSDERRQSQATSQIEYGHQILRAEHISSSIENAMRRERTVSSRLMTNATETKGTVAQPADLAIASPPRLGSSYRRSNLRTSRSTLLRDGKS